MGQDRPKVPCPQCGKRDFTYWNSEKREWFCWLNEAKQKYGCGAAWDEGGQLVGKKALPPSPGYTPPNQYPPPSPPLPPPAPPAAPPPPAAGPSAVVLTLTNARGQQVALRISFE